MDFSSLLRRDLQFLCKKNKIPANMTNVAMADALKSLETVEGLDEYMNQFNSNAPQSLSSVVAKQPPNTATRTTRRKTTVKAEPQSSSQLVTRSCRTTSKSLAGDMDQENINKNVVQEPKANNLPKTPAARSTRKASAATSCSSKVQESKNDELVQSVYSTRRSTRLLEKCMADLSLKTKETLEKSEKIEVTEQKVSAQEKNPSGSEAEFIPGRDLSVSMQKEWENLKNDKDQVVGDFEIYVDFGDIDVSDSNTETNKEKMNEVTSDEKDSGNSLVQVDKQEETLQAICEEAPKKNDDEEISVDLGDIHVLEYANTETHNDDQESKNVQAFDSLVQVDQKETEEAVQEDDSEPEKLNSFNEETMVDQTVSDAGDSKAVQAIQENNSELEKISSFDEENKTDSDATDSETEAEEDDSGVDSDGAISEAESNHAVLGSDIADEEMTLSESEAPAAAPTSPLLEEAEIKTTPLSPFAAKSMSVQFPSKPTEASAAAPTSLPVLEEAEVKTTPLSPEDSAAAPTSSHLLVEAEVKTIPLSPQASAAAPISSPPLLEETEVKTMPLSPESSAAIPTSPPLLEEANVKATPLSLFSAGSISSQFPRPSKPATTPLKNSALKLVNENKENNMEMMMIVNNDENGEIKGEEGKKRKKVTVDEENLKDVSMRQLVKMVKELSIKSSNRPALKILPSNNQIAE